MGDTACHRGTPFGLFRALRVAVTAIPPPTASLVGGRGIVIQGCGAIGEFQLYARGLIELCICAIYEHRYEVARDSFMDAIRVLERLKAPVMLWDQTTRLAFPGVMPY